jgi:hypothetical protein
MKQLQPSTGSPAAVYPVEASGRGSQISAIFSRSGHSCELAATCYVFPRGAWEREVRTQTDGSDCSLDAALVESGTRREPLYISGSHVPAGKPIG